MVELPVPYFSIHSLNEQVLSSASSRHQDGLQTDDLQLKLSHS